MLRYKRLAGSLPHSSGGTGLSAWLEHEPPNFPASPLALMRKFMSMIKTIALAIRIVPGAVIRWDGTVGGCCSRYKYPQVGFREILSLLMAMWALKVTSGLHVCTCMCVLMGIRVWNIHFRSGCVAKLGAGSWVFLSPVLPSSSGRWTYGAPSFPPHSGNGNNAPYKDRREVWVNKPSGRWKKYNT